MPVRTTGVSPAPAAIGGGGTPPSIAIFRISLPYPGVNRQRRCAARLLTSPVFQNFARGS